MNDEKTVRLMLGYLCTATEADASLVRKVEILDRFGLSAADVRRFAAARPSPASTPV